MLLRREFQHLRTIERRRIAMPEGVTLRLSRLERPEPWSAELQAMICKAVIAEVERVQQYPSYSPFYEELAAFNHVPVDNLVVGAGIEEFIRALMFLAAAPGEKVAIMWPTCAMFELYARAFGHELVRVAAKPGECLSVDALLGQLPEDVRLFILPNPGQPVETCYRVTSLERLARKLRERGAVLAVDEAYFGFGAPTAIHVADQHENMVVLRTFSKAYGAASIRLGYAVAGPRLARSLNAVRQSGEVSSMSMAVASVLMRYSRSLVEPGVRAICQARDYLRETVAGEMKLRAWGQWANHVLIEFPSKERVSAITAALALRGVLVKADFPEPLDRHMLVTCGSPALMDTFLEELHGVFDCE
jgi:histidinol-phosphate/aromatic aminotransferase/cobyric acid decarboxylase-like protein